MENKKRIDVSIMDKKYTIVAEESEEKVREVAEYVDNMMTELSKRNPRLVESNVSVLCAINLAGELFKEKEFKDKVEEDYYEELEIEMSLLSEENSTLKAKLAEYETELITNKDKLNVLNNFSIEIKEELEEKKKELRSYEVKFSQLQDKCLKTETDYIHAKKEIRELKAKLDIEIE